LAGASRAFRIEKKRATEKHSLRAWIRLSVAGASSTASKIGKGRVKRGPSERKLDRSGWEKHKFLELREGD